MPNDNKEKQIQLATAVLRANGYAVVPPDPATEVRPARVALLALARMTFDISAHLDEWPDARQLLRRLSRDALVSVDRESKETANA